MSFRASCAALLLGGLLAAAPAATAQSDGGTSLEGALIEILRERGLLDDAQYAELLELARARAASSLAEIDLIEARLARLSAPEVRVDGGAAGKLAFSSADGAWSLRLKGRVVPRFESLDSSDSSKDENNFSVPRSRLELEGNAGGKELLYRLEFDAATGKTTDPAPKTGTTGLRDAYVDHPAPLGAWPARLRFGQFRFPFGREMLSPSGGLSFTDRSVASVEFSPDYEPGAMLAGQFGEGAFDWQLGLSNGDGRGKPNSAGSSSDGLRHGLRVVWNPLGPLKLDGPAFQTFEDGSTRLGLGASWMSNSDSSGLATVTPGADTTTLGLEAGLFTGPFSFLAEQFDRSGHFDAAPDVDDDGFTLQAGWLFDEAVWELVARRSTVDYGAKDDITETALGLNWYRDRHNGKWQLELASLDWNGATPDARRVRVQYQAIF